ncbi:MAG: DNA polymerase III subunit delta' [Sphaerospermopsis sp. SIO1G2]|nr:DNA polymerase III subunit delta' [Sphaerospermopsis sp. SIO1G2]
MERQAMSNWGVIGHDWAIEQLQTAVTHGRIGHAYLITGPAQVGRTTLARAFAQALNCTNDYLNNRPCGVCRSCKLIANGRHPDLFTVTPEISARGRATIKIDQIRQLQKDLNLAAIEGRYKIAILENFETANPSAANAFLKTLEEPPPNVVLILTASEADAMLPTINSRCRTVSLRPVSTPLIAHALQQDGLTPPQQAQEIAHVANGRIGWAMQAAKDPKIWEAHQAYLTELSDILAENRVGRFAIAEKLAKKPEELHGRLQAWSGWWRDLTMIAWGQLPQKHIINLSHRAQLAELAEKWTQEKLLTSLKQTDQAMWQLNRNANVRLVLECLFLQYPYATQ